MKHLNSTYMRSKLFATKVAHEAAQIVFVENLVVAFPPASAAGSQNL